ncbi:MAG: DUF6338 family protein [Rhodospirillales bacterium]|nr:DUF6338 family protein [Rhodospirillales bacterium]
MNWATSETVKLLAFLLPGFVAAAVFYSLTSHPKPSQFERVVQALVFTALVQGVTLLILDNGNLGVALLVAVGVGLLFALVSNHDWLHWALRQIRFTRENSHPSEWCSAFSRNRGYVVLLLADGRRLYGWPAEWPNRSDEGHFCILEPEWLLEDGSVQAGGTDAILIPATDVKIVDFMELN